MDQPLRTSLWQTADLLPSRGRWLAGADRTLGDAWGLLAPLRSDGHGAWRVAARPDVVFMLAPLSVDELRELRFASGGEEAERYVCLLRYDHPADRPGSTFNVAADPGLLPSGRALAGTPSRSDNAASVDEVQAALEALWRQHGPALERRFVAGPGPQPQSRTSAGVDHVSFLFASCQYPAGMMDREDANRSYASLARRLDEGMAPPTRILLLGDQVYTDATYGLLDPARLDDRYRLPYEQLAAADGPWAQLPQDLRRTMRMTPDDHEIVDNWEPWFPGATGERHRRGLAAYWRFQRGENAPAGDLWQRLPEAHEPAEGWRVFMADTRSTRDHRSDTSLDTATILGQPQTEALEAWLREAPDDLKVVTSAAMLLPRTRIAVDEPLRLDNWQGYPASFRRLLAFVCDAGIRNLVFLSGDAHLGVSAQVTVRNVVSSAEAAFSSHHAPALYAPYPFANETQWNLRLDDRFAFEWNDLQGRPARYECTVRTQVLEDGVTGWGMLRGRRSGSAWTTEVVFLPNA